MDEPSATLAIDLFSWAAASRSRNALTVTGPGAESDGVLPNPAIFDDGMGILEGDGPGIPLRSVGMLPAEMSAGCRGAVSTAD